MPNKAIRERVEVRTHFCPHTAPRRCLLTMHTLLYALMTPRMRARLSSLVCFRSLRLMDSTKPVLAQAFRLSLPQQALKNVAAAPPPPLAPGRSIPTVELSEEKPHQHVSLPTRPVDHDATTALVRECIPPFALQRP